jgi:protein required for attachment to host cells
MNTPNEVWMLLADARQGRLLRCTESDDGRVRVEDRDSIANTLPSHEHQHSSPLWKNATITFGMEDAEREDLRRFAREVAVWLQQRMDGLRIRRVHILASGRFLGALRKVRPAQLAGRHALERKADLMHLSAGKLAKHPVIRQLMVSARSLGPANLRVE